MSNQPLIRIENLHSHFADKHVLKDINLDIHEGEIMVVMGGSGSGKSTLLNHMLALLKPTSGRITLDGIDVASAKGKVLQTLRQRIGVAFQGGALLSSMTVAENIRLPLQEHSRLDDNTMNIMIRMKLELMNLAGAENLYPAQLSGGMLKRAGLARAVIMDPKILFFDEPSAGLDPVTSVELDELILDLRNAMKMTIVVVTHELDSAFKIADRIAILLDGRLALCGTPDEIRASDDERIQNLINRRPNKDKIEGDAYLQRLATGE